MDELGQLLIEKNYSLSSAESFTVGTFASQIGLISGISQVYKGSIVSYQTIIKETVLNIDKKIVDTYGVVSKECAYEMCKNCQQLFQSDIAISFTGNAGPTTIEDKEVGLIYIGIAYGKEMSTYEYHFSGNRIDIVNQGVNMGCKILLEKLQRNLQK